jgi:hypothetical protein
VTKPPLPASLFDPFPRVDVDTADDSPFARIVRMAVGAAHGWTFSPDGPYKTPGQTPAQVTHMEVREALLHLLELGFIDVDVERIEAAPGWPAHREIRVTERKEAS